MATPLAMIRLGSGGAPCGRESYYHLGGRYQKVASYAQHTFEDKTIAEESLALDNELLDSTSDLPSAMQSHTNWWR